MRFRLLTNYCFTYSQNTCRSLFGRDLLKLLKSFSRRLGTFLIDLSCHIQRTTLSQCSPETKVKVLAPKVLAPDMAGLAM